MKPGGAQTTWNGPLASCEGTLPGARAKRQGEWWGADAAGARGHNRLAAHTRRETGPRPRDAQTTWNRVSAGEDKGHPEGATNYTHRGGREEGGRAGTGTGVAPPDLPGAPLTHNILHPPRQ